MKTPFQLAEDHTCKAVHMRDLLLLDLYDAGMLGTRHPDACFIFAKAI